MNKTFDELKEDLFEYFKGKDFGTYEFYNLTAFYSNNTHPLKEVLMKIDNFIDENHGDDFWTKRETIGKTFRFSITGCHCDSVILLEIKPKCKKRPNNTLELVDICFSTVAKDLDSLFELAKITTWELEEKVKNEREAFEKTLKEHYLTIEELEKLEKIHKRLYRRF